jgi:hypothetical protein
MELVGVESFFVYLITISEPQGHFIVICSVGFE